MMTRGDGPIRINEVTARQGPQLFRSNPTYARVYFALRRHFNLTISECLLIDVVVILSRRTGWCFASREYLAGLFGVSPRSVQRMIARLIDESLLERNPTNIRLIRPGKRYQESQVSLEKRQG